MYTKGKLQTNIEMKNFMLRKVSLPINILKERPKVVKPAIIRVDTWNFEEVIVNGDIIYLDKKGLVDNPVLSQGLLTQPSPYLVDRWIQILFIKLNLIKHAIRCNHCIIHKFIYFVRVRFTSFIAYALFDNVLH